MSTAHGGAGGAIVNVSSAASRLGSPGEYVDYAASKGAVDSLTRGLAVEVAGEEIRVNGVRPGFINTGIHASGGDPDRVARMQHTLPMKRGGAAGGSSGSGPVAAVAGGVLRDRIVHRSRGRQVTRRSHRKEARASRAARTIITPDRKPRHSTTTGP